MIGTADTANVGLEQQEIERLVGEFAAKFGTGDLAGAAALYAEGAELQPPGGATLHGRAAVEQFWRSVHASGVRAVRYEPQAVELQGERAYEWGSIALTAEASDGTPQTVRVRYVAQWQWRAEPPEPAVRVRWTSGG